MWVFTPWEKMPITLSPPKQKGGEWTETVLHNFAGTESGKQYGDGGQPNGGLALDRKGDIYGTTLYGGNGTGECGEVGCGTVFKLVPPVKAGGWTEKIIVRLNGQDCANPPAGVVFGKDGNLYGTAYAGGDQGNGGVFELKKPVGNSGAWTEKVLHLFSGNDGDNPMAGLIFGTNDDLYGTTYAALSESGTVFRLIHAPVEEAWTFAVLYGFKGPPDAALPAAGLTFDGAGNLYSTTQEGGNRTACQFGCGTVFEVSP